MNKRKKMVVKIVAVVAIICAVSLVLPVPCNPWLPVVIVARAFGASRIRVRLLCETAIRPCWRPAESFQAGSHEAS